MKALITQTGQLGPFASITRTTGDTGWLAGDCIYPDGVVGEAAEGSVAFSATGGTLGGGVCSSTNAAVSGGSGRVKYLGYDLL